MLASCGGTDHTVTVGGDVGIEYSKAVFKVVNGIKYEGEMLAGIIVSCMAVDESATYDAEWGELKIQNLNRTTSYTQEEMDNCS